MKWVTRENVKVDRVASPWLIKKFIDKNAKFLFVSALEVETVAKEEKAISFDAPNAKYTHQNNKCTFEVLIEAYKLKDPALKELAKIVHGADVSADINVTSESAGLKAIATGFLYTCKDDFERLEKEFPIYDALYAYCQKKLTEKG